MALPEAYEGYYNDLASKLMEQVGTVDYTPMSTGTLKSALQKIIRPTYDKNIQQRQQATKSNRAAVDADAAARGIGASTWVSDMKNRLATNEARDIANINDDYSSQLYSALMNRLADQEQLSMAAQQANMNARQGALGNALSGAQYLYGLDQANAGGGGGGGRGGGGSRKTIDDETPTMPAPTGFEKLKSSLNASNGTIAPTTGAVSTAVNKLASTAQSNKSSIKQAAAKVARPNQTITIKKTK